MKVSLLDPFRTLSLILLPTSPGAFACSPRRFSLFSVFTVADAAAPPSASMRVAYTSKTPFRKQSLASFTSE